MPRSRRAAPAPQLHAIIFDIGRVIVRVEPGRALAKLAASGNAQARPKNRMSGDDLWQAIQSDPLWQDWQEGRVTPAQWHQNLCRRFGLQLSFADFCEAWNSTIPPRLLLPESLFARLAKRCRLVLLSNTDPLHVAHMESSFAFMRHFAARIYSCDVHASKPSRAIFTKAIRAAQAPKRRILFIDDVAEYVAAAKRIGVQAVQFRDRAQLEAELRRRGVL
jgi:FMN phosphatase YigB (HAD superfamily)